MGAGKIPSQASQSAPARNAMELANAAVAFAVAVAKLNERMQK
jgi:hypothetical protein